MLDTRSPSVLLNHLGRLIALTGTAAVSALLAQAPFGVHPRSSPSDYDVSRQAPSATYAASIVPRDEVKHLFAIDISKNYVVLEVACYPPAGPVQISADDFLIKSGNSSSEFTHPADAVTVAAVIQDKNTQAPPSNRTTTVYTTAEVGYESATDPATGRRIHGTYTDVGTGVAVGLDNMPPSRPGSTPFDRMTLQQQLAQRALPDGTFSAPVAGFLYFPSKELKKKNGVYELEYLAGGSDTVRLQVPVKAR
jgi:hypothetical protein